MSLTNFAQLLKDTIGLDAESIGVSTLERAVRERQSACGSNDSVDYWQHVQGSDAERQQLVETVVVPETWFFRDSGAFDALLRVAEEWRTPPDRTVRILSVPCSSGEEPYTIALTLLTAGLRADQFQVDAIDVSERVLAQAGRGVFGRNSFRGRDLAFRDRYFEAGPDGFLLPERFRRPVRFQRGNLLSPEFLAHEEPYDAIFCRNLLIYFDRATQDRAIGTLTRLLAPQGVLFVGASETGALLQHEFTSAQMPMAFAFRKTPASNRPATSLRAGRARTRPPLPPAKRNRAATPEIREASGDVTVAGPARRAAPASPPVLTLDAASQLADRGEFAEAEKCCEAHLRHHGPSAPAFYLLGLVCDAAGRESDAETFYRKALYLDPEHRETLVHLALLMHRHGRPGDAEVLKQRVRRLEKSGGA